jgi:hypothetical protein
MEFKPRRSILGSAIAAALFVPVAALAQQPQSQPQHGWLDDEITITGTRISLIAQLGLPNTCSTIDFGDINNLFDQEPRATAQILGRASVNEFNQASLLYDILVGARLTF